MPSSLDFERSGKESLLMLTFAVVEVSGRQYVVEPGKKIQVDYLGDKEEYLCEKVLLLADGKDLKIGAPYLKETLKFKIEETKRGDKIRVGTYHAKANTRRIKGSRSTHTILQLS